MQDFYPEYIKNAQNSTIKKYKNWQKICVDISLKKIYR